MKPIHLIVAGAFLLAAGAATARERLSPEAELAELVAGRSLDPSVSCIRQRDIRSTNLIPGVGVVYRMTNGTLYINRPAGGVSRIDSDAIMVTQTYSAQLCRGDIVQLIDRNSHINAGGFGLGEFEVYSRRAKGMPAG